MKIIALSCCALSLSAAALLAACGGSQPPIGAPVRAGATADGTTSSSYQVLYNFQSGSDGSNPYASLIDVNGTLYGTTWHGGTDHCDCGTVFSIAPSGTEQVLHIFGNGSDGASPAAGLIEVNGKLYGTTCYGGAYDRGTVFRISTNGAEKVLHSFSYSDGVCPEAALLDVKGSLYGTTWSGGAYDYGTVFKISKAGVVHVLHSFGGGADGENPYASLIDVNGTLYGTTTYGGAYGVTQGDGTFFAVSERGTEQVLHDFGGGSDGKYPMASLINVNGTLYSTTYYGGVKNEGTVFSISTTGSEQIVHNFGYNPGGRHPFASGVIDVNGKLYGMSIVGGTYDAGTIFRIRRAGGGRVLYSFGSGSDGKNPVAGLTDVDGTFYGAVSEGGAYGYGSVFAFRP